MPIVPVPEIELEDADGNVYPLEYPGNNVMEASGLGMPPIEHHTTRAPYQDGRTFWSYSWQPRVINLILFLRGCGRQGFWDGRAYNIEMLNPQNGPHKMRLSYPNGEIYELHDGYYTSGYSLSSESGGGSWQIGDAQLVFYDPFWKWVNAPLNAGEARDTNGRSCIYTSVFATEDWLILPFDGPFYLGVTTQTATLTVVNNGTLIAKPVILVEGPTLDWKLTNETTRDELEWDGYEIATGEVVTLNVPDNTVTNAAGTNLSTYVEGDFRTFGLAPGSNTLTFLAYGGATAGTTTITCCWYSEVLGL